MKTLIKTGAGIAVQYLRPFAHRAGTILSGWLLSGGVPNDLTEQVVTALGVVVLLSVDVGVALIERKGRS